MANGIGKPEEDIKKYDFSFLDTSLTPQVEASTTNSAGATPFPLGTYKDYGTDLMIVGFVDVKGSADPDTVAAGPATGPHKGNIIELSLIHI